MLTAPIHRPYHQRTSIKPISASIKLKDVGARVPTHPYPHPLETDPPPLFVCGDYEFMASIGGGGESKVYRVRSRRDNSIFAGKIVNREGYHGVGELPEFAAISALSHPNIVECYDAFTDPRGLILIFELCGGTLQELIRSTGGLTDEEVRSLARQLMSALSFMHEQGFAHRDVKPSNVLLDWRQRTAKLADFGMARRERRRRSQAGTPSFLPREAWLGYEHDLQLGDVWQLGVTLACALRGDLPWGALSEPEMVRRIIDCDAEFPCTDRALAAAIRRMICPEGSRMTIAELSQLPVFRPRVPSLVFPRIEGRVGRAASEGSLAVGLRVPRLPRADVAPRRASLPLAVPAVGSAHLQGTAVNDRRMHRPLSLPAGTTVLGRRRIADALRE
jgi:serine/threonine protein kinase